MIDVPVRVRDALKSGAYKKEYNVTVYRKATDWTKIDTLTVLRIDTSNDFNTQFDLYQYPAGSQCRFSCPYENGFTSLRITGNNITTINVNATSTPTETYAEFTLSETIRFCTITFYGVTFRPSSYNWAQFDMWQISDNYYEEITLDNDYLVAESVKFDEMMCSGSELKFGLCEGTSAEFQYFNYRSIYGCKLNILLKAQYIDENSSLAWYSIPMGHYEVDKCSRQASTGIYKVTAYNKLRSAYLDSVEDVKAVVEAGEAGQPGEVSVRTLLNALLEDFAIEEAAPMIRNLDSSTFVIPPSHSSEQAYVNRAYGGGYLQVWQSTVFFTLPAQTLNGYYRYTVYAQEIYAYIRNLLNYDNEYIVGTSGNRYSLDELARTVGIAAVGGAATLKNSGGTTLEEFSNLSLYRHPTTDFYTDNTGIYVTVPIGVVHTDYVEQLPSQADFDQMNQNWDSILRNVVFALVQEKVYSTIEGKKITTKDVLNGLTLRDLQSAVFEIDCVYGKLDRETDKFSGVSLNNSRLYPRDSLYPANNLYPNGAVEGGFPAMYSKLWADEDNLRSFKDLIITYKTTEVIDGQSRETESQLTRTVNEDGTDNYNMTDNWLFRNLVWTAQQVAVYADAMVLKMRDIRWFPFEMWSVGLPYLETGDEIEISVGNKTYPTYVLHRTLSGIQNLQDEMINGTLDIF